MDVKKAAERYQQTNYATLSTIEYVLLLLNECLHYVAITETAVQTESKEELYEYISKTQHLLFELMAATNTQSAEGKRLSSFYVYLNQSLVEVRLNKEPAVLEMVKQHLEELIESWEVAKQKGRIEKYTTPWI
ncbi:MAG TPA: flagellar protein FliS [Sporosarcina psychrophila]|uniref:Flagellar protein FliS n=1 Tax=Sporosarcina psychrophila TaxID=1476 RepID=A0A921G0Y7_SPOPS|nr:flagellar protein FliS [Sporosarcina psychrophila]